MNHAFSLKQKRLCLTIVVTLLAPQVAWGVDVTTETELRAALGAGTDPEINVKKDITLIIQEQLKTNPLFQGSTVYLNGTPSDPSDPNATLASKQKNVGPNLDHFFVVKDIAMVIQNLNFDATWLSGSAVTTTDSGSIQIKGTKFFGAMISGNGGAVYSNNVSAGIDDSSFYRNESTEGSGGAIVAAFLSGGINNSWFGLENEANSGNIAKNDGGAVYVSTDIAGINGSYFYRNESTTGSGGAVYAFAFSSLSGINNSWFGSENVADSGNTAYLNGGAVYTDFLTYGISGSHFYRNEAKNGSGGAVYVDHYLVGEISNSYFGSPNVAAGNTAYLDGGAVYVGEELVGIDRDGVVIRGGINASLFYENESINGNGGAVYVGKDLACINDSDFEENRASHGSGGAIFVGGNLLEGIHAQTSGLSFFSGNRAGADGGAVYVGNNFNGGIQNSDFLTNHAGNGGAVFVVGDFSDGINTSNFIGNTALNNGGAIAVMGTMAADLSNSSFASNSATGTAGKGGALYLEQGGTLTADSGDVSFSDNYDATGHNAIHVASGALTLDVGTGNTMDFQDPISSGTELTDFDLNPNGDGTLRFSTYASDVRFAQGILGNGTLQLVDGARIGNATNTGKFVQAAGSTLEILPGMKGQTAAINAQELELNGKLDFRVQGGDNNQSPTSMPSVNGDVLLSSTADRVELKDTEIAMSMAGNAFLDWGEYVILIDNDHVTGTFDTGSPLGDEVSVQTIEVPSGSTLTYTLSVEIDKNGDLIALRKAVPASPPGQPNLGLTPTSGNRILAQGYGAGMATLTRGADLVSDLGIDRAVDAARVRTGVQAFGILSGGKERFITGSHINLTGYNAMAGLAYQEERTSSTLTVGAFIEYGSSHYRTVDFVSGSRYQGDGNGDYVGGGILARWDSSTTGDHFYLEGLLRAGQVKTEFNSNDLLDQYTGVRAEYDTQGGYYGGTLGLGYVWELDELNSINVYGKVLWVQQSDEDTTLSTLEYLDFDAVRSVRARVGARYQHEFKAKGPHAYTGLAYQEEFEGRIRVSSNGVPLDQYKFKGGTGMAEAGLVFTNMGEQQLTFEFAVQGYVGRREGVLGSFRINYLF